MAALRDYVCRRCGADFASRQYRPPKYCGPRCYHTARVGRPKMDIRERFMRRVAKSDNGCWIWTAARIRGYGVFRVAGRNIRAPRVSYELFVGPVPRSLSACHHCDNPPCVNPAHLFLGTQKDNMLDMAAKGRGTSGRRR